MIDLDSLVDVKRGIQKKRIFVDRELYELEQARIFARAWQFLTHECLIPNIGDYATAKMGEDEVLVVRQRDRTIRAFLNVCSHRGARVCAAEAGNARGFTCPYHGWGYGLDGALANLPFEKDAYYSRLDKLQHGLKPLAKIESYHGFVYGCFDPHAPSFREYLGDAAYYLDTLLGVPGGLELIGPPSRSLLKCNWKTPAENFVGDMYHVGWTHAGSMSVIAQGPGRGLIGNPPLPLPAAQIGMQFTSQRGHGASVTYGGTDVLCPAEALLDLRAWQAQRQRVLRKTLSAERVNLYASTWNMTIFPNNTFLWGPNTFKVWAPRGPEAIECFTWVLAETEMPQALKVAISHQANATFGTAGILESEDSDNMESMTLNSRGFMSRQLSLNAQMGRGNEREHPEYPGLISDSNINEMSYRGFYRAYREMLKADSWAQMNCATQAWKRELLEGGA